MTKDTNVFKGQARRLYKHLKATSSDVSYAQSLEAVAALHGYANWRTMQAQAPSPALLSEREFAQYMADQYADGSIEGEHPEFLRGRWRGEVLSNLTSQGYWAWVNTEMQKSRTSPHAEDGRPRFLISEGWGHLFEAGPHEDTVRFVYDRRMEKIILVDILFTNGWFEAGTEQVVDVETSLKYANSEALDSPEEWDLEESSELPDWAQGRITVK